ncbi:hypothetical protein GGF38_002751 [Coemansia sp. RSA 25]|nr:hypothetical protein GGF38_002751 [Coemansia sp. RSA 25]
MYPSDMRYLRIAGVPPMACKSSITYLPLGFMSAKNGVRFEISWKSSNVRLIPIAREMAIKCRTTLVDPPMAMAMVIAFSNALRVMISFGHTLSSRILRMAAPTLKHSSSFSCDVAGDDDEYGRVMPMASAAVAIVLAVYMPPHPPGPGHACLTASNLSASLILPATYEPYASNVDTMS